MLALFFVGLALLAAFPALSYRRQELARYYSDRAKVSYDARDFARSVLYWQRSIKAEPADPNSHFGLAKACEGLGADEEALREYQLAIKMNPQFYDAYLAAAGIHLVKRKDYAAALTEIAQALQQGPRDVCVQSSLYTDLAWANIGVGQWEQAHRNLVHAIRLDQARGSAHCLLAQTLEAASKVDWASSEWGLCATKSNQRKSNRSGERRPTSGSVAVLSVTGHCPTVRQGYSDSNIGNPPSELPLGLRIRRSTNGPDLK